MSTMSTFIVFGVRTMLVSAPDSSSPDKLFENDIVVARGVAMFPCAILQKPQGKDKRHHIEA